MHNAHLTKAKKKTTTDSADKTLQKNQCALTAAHSGFHFLPLCFLLAALLTDPSPPCNLDV